MRGRTPGRRGNDHATVEFETSAVQELLEVDFMGSVQRTRQIHSRAADFTAETHRAQPRFAFGGCGSAPRGIHIGVGAVLPDFTGTAHRTPTGESQAAEESIYPAPIRGRGRRIVF